MKLNRVFFLNSAELVMSYDIGKAVHDERPVWCKDEEMGSRQANCPLFKQIYFFITQGCCPLISSIPTSLFSGMRRLLMFG